MHADDNDHVVINVVNGYVYVSLGSRDGAEVGDHIEILGENGAAFGVLELDLCGEVICRARLADSLSGKIARGMLVRAARPTAPEPVDPVVPVVTPPSEVAKPPSEPDESGPDVIPYREPIPKGYQLKRTRYSGLVTLGWVGMSITYGITALVGLGGNEDQKSLLLPVVGPLLYLAVADDYFGKPPTAPYVLSSLLQGASLISMIAGYSGSKSLVRIGSGASVSIAPVVTNERAFLSVVGRF